MYLYMDRTQMYNEPQISNEKCKELSSENFLLLNQKTRFGDKLVIKEGRKYIDSVYNFTDKRYAEIVQKLKGKVLILGLGLGCNVIRASQKKQVKEVDVLEINTEVIKLFKRIYGKFQGVEKINIYHDDAMKAKWIGKNYDHVFIDIYNVQFDRKMYDKNMAILKDRYKDSTVHFIEIYKQL